MGLGTDVVMSVTLKWFPDKQGLASGAMLMGFGGGTMLLSPVVTTMLGTLGWRLTFGALGVIFAVLVGAGAFIMKPVSYTHLENTSFLPSRGPCRPPISAARPLPNYLLRRPLGSTGVVGTGSTGSAVGSIAALGRARIGGGAGSLLRRSSRLGTSPARSLARLVGRSLGLLHLAASGRQVAVGFHLLLERLGSHRLGMGFGLRGLLGRQGCRFSRSRPFGIGRRRCV